MKKDKKYPFVNAIEALKLIQTNTTYCLFHGIENNGADSYENVYIDEDLVEIIEKSLLELDDIKKRAKEMNLFFLEGAEFGLRNKKTSIESAALCRYILTGDNK